MNSIRKGEMKAVAALILLSMIPVAAGIVRMVRLAAGEEITADNARFFASPAPVVIHVVSVVVFCIIGAFQFDQGFRNRNPRWHRIAGRFVFVSGILAALSGLWMTRFYPLRPDLQGNLLYGIRMLTGSCMVLFLILSFMAIRKRDLVSHKAWVVRGYALGQGAGTQALLLIPWTLIAGKPELFTYELLMMAGWLINVIFAEWLIRRSVRGKFLNIQLAS